MMTKYLSDKEQIEIIKKKWWRDCSRAIVTIIVVGFLTSFGWLYWHRFQIEKTERASQIYTKLQAATLRNQQDESQKLTNELMKGYAKTPYAAMAALLVAKDDVKKNHLDRALIHLQWVIENSLIRSLKQIARLRAARILLVQNHLEKALKLLQVLDNPIYHPLVDSVKGDIYLAMGKQASAKQFYTAAQNGMKALGIDDPYLAMKI
ncbi:YfgM family protein [Coxiella endosymbiont of Amblyomma nuttalli]|uniref:YfgM family protein n=1 Tax=Coxiella endosymbiont of Amblyomma nuttalli TaxID=2749996 RepID=UPI001BB7B0EA|nr:tetratricopeptide repeat protein [Coxiella endosymbiont of Amblyomma nuttalli]QTS83842.1 hypothetical protein CEAn_00316 [Coxiella endosymbiont of Amblyomma nuttalli]